MAYGDQVWDKLTASTNKAANAMGLKDDSAADEQKRIMDDVLRDIEGLSPPELEQLELENPEWLNDLVYQKADTALQGDSALNQISTDPRLRDTQMGALDALQGVVDSGGLNATDAANLQKIQTQSATADKGRRDAIKQSMAQRGMGGSGMELLQQLQSNQAATDRASQSGLDVAGMAQDRALQAMMQGGQLAGNIQGQDFGQQAQIFSAEDAINKFNTGNINQGNRFNTSNQLRTDQYNNQGQQNIANQGVDLRNQANTYNTQELPQQNWQNQVDHTGMITNAKTGQANQIGQQSSEDKRTAGNFWGTVATGAAAASGGGSEAALAAEAAKKKEEGY